MKPDQQTENLADYYARRASEYEEIYYRDDKQRQHEQANIKRLLQEVLIGADVLEVACGAGYWTRFASETANKIMATDVNDEVLEIARRKHYSCTVLLEKANAHNLPFEADSFTGGLANFWLSHVPKNRIREFLGSFHSKLKKGSTVFMADNMRVAGVGGDLVGKDGDENTYKLRTLKDGSQQEILKNYFTQEELLHLFRQYDAGLSVDNIFIGKCFWYLSYRI